MARNGSNLHRRGRIYYYKYVDGNGKRHEKSTGAEKYAEARSIRDLELEKIRRGQLPNEMARWTLEQACRHWMEYRAATRERSTLPPERSSTRHLMAALGESKRLDRITSLDLIRYQMARRQTVGPKTVNNELLVLAGILRQAKLWRELGEDYKPLPVPKRGPGRALTAEEAAHLIATALADDDWAVALCAAVLAASAGCRSWEIKSLRLTDIDHTRKNDPLHGGDGFDPTHHQRSWATAWDSLRRRAGLAGFRFHDLRHTYITNGIEGGIPIEVIMAQVGHISADMTRYYTHLSTHAKHAAAAKVQERNPELASLLGIDSPSLAANREAS